MDSFRVWGLGFIGVNGLIVYRVEGLGPSPTTHPRDLLVMSVLDSLKVPGRKECVGKSTGLNQ